MLNVYCIYMKESVANADKKPHYYSSQEESVNIWSHVFGFVLSVVVTALLLIKITVYGDFLQITSIAIYGFSLMNLYAASSLYHRSIKPESRLKWQIVDHASIYILIAGTYTPFTLITLHGVTGWMVFGVVWGAAIAGVILKLFYTGRFEILSTIMYIVMGWMVIFVIKPLYLNLPVEGLIWLFGRGVTYTTGAVLFSIPRIKFNHAIFHIFVLIGSFCHFMAIYFYVLK